MLDEISSNFPKNSNLTVFVTEGMSIVHDRDRIYRMANERKRYGAYNRKLLSHPAIV